MTRRLVLIGSGENAPTMVTNHQRWLADVPSGIGSAALLNTTYGFQEGVDAITNKLCGFFRDSVGRKIECIDLRNSESDVVTAVRSLANASWVFAGPGSPTYALSVWQSTEFAEHLQSVLTRGTVVLASAAAVTSGTRAVPVYEIYKVGEPASWRPGLNLVEAATGLKASVIPHFNNAEGGLHDTRFCYIGERRLSELEGMLDEDEFILGIDEHTALVFDLDSNSFEVVGRGVVTVRKFGTSTTFSAGHSGAISDLASAAEVPAADPTVTVHDSGSAATSTEPELPIAPFVDELLTLRKIARQEKRFAESDAIRDFLTRQGISVEDGTEGSSWRFSE